MNNGNHTSYPSGIQTCVYDSEDGIDAYLNREIF